MPVTLAQAKVGMTDHIDTKVIETIQRNSLLLDKMVFDDAVSVGGSGSTLTYGYLQLKTPIAGAIRQLNADYTPAVAERQKLSVDLAIMGASYEIDRVIAQNSDARIDEVGFQTEQATKGTLGYFQYLMVNGVKATHGFDGLSTALTGTTNEIDASAVSVASVTSASAEALCEALDTAINSLDSTDNVVILCNGKMKAKLTASARMLNYHAQDKDDFGHVVDKYNDFPIIDLKQATISGTMTDVIPVSSGKTDIYVVRLGLDAFCGVTPKGGVGLNVITPNFADAGAVHKGEVEIVGAVALKNTLAGAVLRNITIA